MKSFTTLVSLSALVIGLTKVSQVEAIPNYAVANAAQSYGTTKSAYGNNVVHSDINYSVHSDNYDQNGGYAVKVNYEKPSYDVKVPDNLNYGKTANVHYDSNDDDDDHPERYTKADYGLDITKILKLVNDERAKYNAKPLRINRKLMSACKEQAEYQSRSRKMTHIGSGGLDFKARCEKQDYFSSNNAENIAYGPDCEEDVVKIWINSSEYHANLINPIYTECGVSSKDNYWSQLFGCGNTEKKY